MREVVESTAGLIASGMARQWAVAMWSAPQLGEALDIASELGAPPPVANQLACSLVQHESADDPAIVELMANRGVGLVASYVLAGGTLTGKYIGDAAGRASDDDAPPYGAGKRVAVALAELAREWGVTTSQLAFCYALGHPNLTERAVRRHLTGATARERGVVRGVRIAQRRTTGGDTSPGARERSATVELSDQRPSTSIANPSVAASRMPMTS